MLETHRAQMLDACVCVNPTLIRFRLRLRCGEHLVETPDTADSIEVVAWQEYAALALLDDLNEGIVLAEGACVYTWARKFHFFCY